MLKLRRPVVLGVAVLVIAAAGYGGYYVSPYGRHDREAASYEQQFRQRVVSLGGVTVVHSGHQVSDNQWGEGGECSLIATLEIRTGLSEQAFTARLRKVLAAHPDEYVHEDVAAVGGGALRVQAATLIDGGSLDLRCG
ncbi:hypothetical protein POF50_008220 [Streptomyces sp. SL13]|uniref:Uncharacterized protein n=1 Tax=Streptantibioticus silvisoli TaxID=2705255 RepID=A0AA90KFI9_9ACTN|nr:hypothetical protein [Streptantibioticus silvisoli]MDI5963461.1 hypothetical protein [Streptantibioticus silvisoli]MDI5969330.1 hypothetical protein [Streptantibioticus silvisoli]